MEEVVEATAIAVSYFGNAILESKSRQLLKLARGVEEAADAAGVDRGDLSRAARALDRADDEGRIRAVVDLGDASAALEKIARAPLDELRGAAAQLARACREYRGASDAISKAQRATEERARRSCWNWWSSRQCHQARNIDAYENLLADEESRGQSEPEKLANDVLLPIDMAGEAREEPDAEREADALVVAAKNLAAAADGAGVAPEELMHAIGALEQSGDPARLNLIADLGTAATAMERSDSTSENTLGDRAANLARACQDVKHAADAMAAVQRAAAEQRERRAAGMADAMAAVQRAAVEEREGHAAGTAAAPVPSDKTGQDNELSSGCLAMQGTALLGALTMLPYMGGPKETDGLLNPDVYWYRGSVGVAFAWFWCFVGIGVLCMMARRPLLHLIARLLSRIGMLLATLLVIFYCQWSLVPDWAAAWLWSLVGIVAALHVFLFAVAWYDGDL